MMRCYCDSSNLNLFLLLNEWMNECRSRSAPTPSPSTTSTAAPARRRRPCSTSAWRRWWRGSSRATTPPCSPTARSVRQSIIHSFFHPSQSHVPFIQSKDPYDTVPGPPRWGWQKASSTSCGAAGTPNPFLPAQLFLPLWGRLLAPTSKTPSKCRLFLWQFTIKSRKMVIISFQV